MSDIDQLISGGSGAGIPGGGAIPASFNAAEADNDQEVRRLTPSARV